MSDHDEKKPLTNGDASAKVSQPDDMHNLFDMPLNMDDDDPLAAMRDDPNYAALIAELEEIAKQARLLFEPAEADPSDKVWEGIAKGLNTPPAEEV